MAEYHRQEKQLSLDCLLSGCIWFIGGFIGSVGFVRGLGSSAWTVDQVDATSASRM